MAVAANGQRTWAGVVPRPEIGTLPTVLFRVGPIARVGPWRLVDGRGEPARLLSARHTVGGGAGDKVVMVGGGGDPPRMPLGRRALNRAAFDKRHGRIVRICGKEPPPQIPGLSLELGTGGVEAHPIGVGIKVDGGQQVSVVRNEVEIIVDRRVHQPGSGAVVVAFVPIVEQCNQARDRPNEVVADAQQPVRGLRHEAQVGEVAVDSGIDVDGAAIGPRCGQAQDPAQATAGDHVAMAVAVGHPVGEHLAPVGGAPDKVGGALGQQMRRAGARPGEVGGRLQVGTRKPHAVDAAHRCVVEPARPQQRRQAWRMPEAVGQIEQPRLLGHAPRPQPLLAHQQIPQQQLVLGQKCVRRGDPAAGEPQPSLVHQANQLGAPFGSVTPIQVDEKEALQAEDAPGIGRQLGEGAIEGRAHTPAVVTISGQQPIGVPMGRLGHDDHLGGGRRDAEA